MTMIGKAKRATLFKSRIALIVAIASFVYFLIALFVVGVNARDAAYYLFGDDPAYLVPRLTWVTDSLWQLTNPVFLFTSAMMIEFLSRISKYLEGIGIMMAKREREANDGE